MKSLYYKKIPLLYLFIIIAITSVSTFLIALYIITQNQKSETLINTNNCNYKLQRMQGYGYIRPLIFVDDECESENLVSVKNKIQILIDNYKMTGDLNSASVYLKDFTSNGWISINDEEKFKPGSLLKIPQLITVLKMNEENPGFLNKVVTFNHKVNLDKNPAYLSKSIQLGQKYTIKELLTYMIVYSDNNATTLLFEHINLKTFKKVFTDLGLESPNLSSADYPITAKEVSYFMRILFNAAYLTPEDSEYATELLGRSVFKDGILKGLPNNTKVAHKFGEAGDPIEKQFNETAIIYLNNNPYMLTIMTKGKENEKLIPIISQISSAVYQEMLNNSSSL